MSLKSILVVSGSVLVFAALIFFFFEPKVKDTPIIIADGGQGVENNNAVAAAARPFRVAFSHSGGWTPGSAGAYTPTPVPGSATKGWKIDDANPESLGDGSVFTIGQLDASISGPTFTVKDCTASGNTVSCRSAVPFGNLDIFRNRHHSPTGGVFKVSAE